MAAETSFFQDRCLTAMDFRAAIGNPCSTERRRCSTSRGLFSTKGRRRTAKREILWAKKGELQQLIRLVLGKVEQKEKEV